MKKLLGIVVLGLLLSGNAYASENENIKIDLIFCGNGLGVKTVYLKDTFDGSCPPSQPMEITFKEFKKKYGWQINKQLCYQPYEKKSSRVFLTPGGPCNRISKTSIKIKYKGGNYYYYGNKEKERKKREELASKKKEAKPKKLENKKSLIGTVWRFHSKADFLMLHDFYKMNFFSNGDCDYVPDLNLSCYWKQNGNKVSWEIAEFARSNVRIIDGKTAEGEGKNDRGQVWSITGKKLMQSVGKKKQQESSDDSKIVAASMGSGFFVTREGHLVTNYHVIEGCDAVKANILGKEIPTDIIAADKTNDLAIIKAEMNPSKVFPVSNEDVSLMQDVIVAGFPLGKKVSSAIKIHKGNVTALAGFGDNYSNFQTDATINQGNSGGPIIDQKGNVVGVAVQLIAAEHAQNVFFGVKSSTLKTFAKANNIKFISPNYREMSNEDLGEFITEATVFLDCWMTVAKIKRIIAQEENRKAFYSEHK